MEIVEQLFIGLGCGFIFVTLIFLLYIEFKRNKDET